MPSFHYIRILHIFIMCQSDQGNMPLEVFFFSPKLYKPPKQELKSHMWSLVPSASPPAQAVSLPVSDQAA